MKNKIPFLLVLLLVLSSLTCQLPFLGSTPTPAKPKEGGATIGTVSREESDVLHSTGSQSPVVVDSSDALFNGDLVRVANGGIGLLDFGDSLKLRLFNDSDLNVVSATEPGIPLVASLFLTVGGFTGELVKSGGKVVFQTPNQAEITVTGTEFFVGYDADKGRATAGKWEGSMQVTSAGQTVSINDGYYVDVYAGQPPGEQIPNPLGREEFERLATSLNDPLEAIERIRPQILETAPPLQTAPPPGYQPTINQLGPIPLEQAVRGEIRSPGEINEYQLNASYGETMVIRLASQDRLHPSFSVRSSTGDSLCDFEGDRIAQGYCAFYEGTFNLQVTGGPEGVGNYSLFVQSLTNPQDGRSVDFNRPYDEFLSDPAAVNTYAFDGFPGNLVMIRAAAAGGDFQPGQWVSLSDQFLNCTSLPRDTLSEIICPLAEQGTHHLFVDDPTGAGSGNYQLVLDNLSNRRLAPVLEPGQRQVDKIGYPTQVNTYTLFGKEGETREVRLILDSGDLQLHVRFFALDGRLLCEGYTEEKELSVPCVLDGSDEYRLVVGDYNGAHTGSYIISLAQPDRIP